MSKTIKQIADELGVSKQAVQKRLSREPLCTTVAPYISTINGTKYIDVAGETFVKSAFKKISIDTLSIDKSIDKNVENASSIDKTSASIDKNKENIGVVEILQSTIDILKGQLDSKDEQFRILQSQLAAKDEQIRALQSQLDVKDEQIGQITAALNAAQALNAADKKSLMLIEEKENGRKLSFWERRAAKRAERKHEKNISEE